MYLWIAPMLALEQGIGPDRAVSPLRIPEVYLSTPSWVPNHAVDRSLSASVSRNGAQGPSFHEAEETVSVIAEHFRVASGQGLLHVSWHQLAWAKDQWWRNVPAKALANKRRAQVGAESSRSRFTDTEKT